MRSFAASVPLAVVALAIVVGLAIVASPALGRSLGTRRAVAGLLIFGFGFVLAATLAPDGEAFEGVPGPGVCDTDRLGLAPIVDYLRPTNTSLNVLLFVPLGIAVAWLPRTPPAAAIAIAAVSLTFIVEATQLLVTALSRGCQTADLVDNLLGLLIGAVVGTLSRPLVR